MTRPDEVIAGPEFQICRQMGLRERATSTAATTHPPARLVRPQLARAAIGGSEVAEVDRLLSGRRGDEEHGRKHARRWHAAAGWQDSRSRVLQHGSQVQVFLPVLFRPFGGEGPT